MKETKVMVFGTFDKIHEGHRFFLHEAEKLGKTLIIIVARDKMVYIHKNKATKNTESERCNYLSMEFPKALIDLGDENENSWEIINKHEPDIIALGYDQKELLSALELGKNDFIKQPVLVILPDHEGDRLHSSLLE